MDDLEIINLNASNVNSPKAILNVKPENLINGVQNQTFSNKSIASPSEQQIKEEIIAMEQKRLFEELVPIFLSSNGKIF